MAVEINGKSIELDNEGYLLYPEDWDMNVAQYFADQLKIDMTDDHWMVVKFVREHFEERQSVPEARFALKAMQQHLGKEKATRKFLYDLFPYGYASMACKIAGMRKPLKLMLDL